VNAAAVLREVLPEKRKAPRVIAIKQLKSGDVVLHTVTTADGRTEEYRK
jgi:hypothetical protein